MTQAWLSACSGIGERGAERGDGPGGLCDNGGRRAHGWEWEGGATSEDALGVSDWRPWGPSDSG